MLARCKAGQVERSDPSRFAMTVRIAMAAPSGVEFTLSCPGTTTGAAAAAALLGFFCLALCFGVTETLAGSAGIASTGVVTTCAGAGTGVAAAWTGAAAACAGACAF